MRKDRYQPAARLEVGRFPSMETVLKAMRIFPLSDQAEEAEFTARAFAR